MADLDPSSPASITGVLGGAIALAVVWGGKLIAKRLGLDPTTAAEANQAAQKDMLDWQKEQLKDEVARREKAETQVQVLLDKLNEVSRQMAHMEQQNNAMKDQMEFMTDQNTRLQEKIQHLTQTVELLKPSGVGAT